MVSILICVWEESIKDCTKLRFKNFEVRFWNIDTNFWFYWCSWSYMVKVVVWIGWMISIAWIIVILCGFWILNDRFDLD